MLSGTQRNLVLWIESRNKGRDILDIDSGLIHLIIYRGADSLS